MLLVVLSLVSRRIIYETIYMENDDCQERPLFRYIERDLFCPIRSRHVPDLEKFLDEDGGKEFTNMEGEKRGSEWDMVFVEKKGGGDMTFQSARQKGGMKDHVVCKNITLGLRERFIREKDGLERHFGDILRQKSKKMKGREGSLGKSKTSNLL